MRIGFETTVNACDAAAVRSSGVAAAGRRHEAAGQPLPRFPGRMKRLDGCRTCAEESTSPAPRGITCLLIVHGDRPGHPAGGPGERMTDDQRRRFDQVYAVHHAAILGYALRRTGNADDAADVIAETFLTAWRRIDDIPAGEAARPWLYGVARRVLANQRRGEQRRSALGERLRSELAAERFHREPPPGLDGVAAALRRLGDTDREILTLAAWEGLDAGQIAVVIGCSRNAARIRLHRARRRLAAALHDTGTAFAPELIRGNS